VETNTSEHDIEEVLSQKQEGKWKPIVFLSRTMQAAERNYKMYDKKIISHSRSVNKDNIYWIP